MKSRVSFEGFYDLDSGYDFSMPVILTFPNIVYFEGGNTGKCEEIIEDYMIDLSNDLEWKNEKDLDKKEIMKALSAAQNGSERFKVWSATVEYYIDDPCTYEILKRKGF